MKPDIRFLIGLNAALFCIALLAAFKVLTLTSPSSDFIADIDRIKQSTSVEAAGENAAQIAKVAMRKGEQLRKERHISAIIAGFSGFVGATNLYFMIILYRKVRNGIYLYNGVELEKS